ncbi:MAG TPA: DUF4157 domain-containing protein [Telluria sp.]|nr:DUF4157 domain-containing protein [Telluria sp.]
MQRTRPEPSNAPTTAEPAHASHEAPAGSFAAAVQASPRAVAQRQLAAGVQGSPRVAAQQSRYAAMGLPVQRAPKGGLPPDLKNGVEALSGMSMDHVQVHYNSSKPAQLNAHAYAQGSAIHLGPGQQHHLPHEAWHVVQQAQGRVKPTLQMKSGTPVNDDAGLEAEADTMGARALAVGGAAPGPEAPAPAPPSAAGGVAQRVQKDVVAQGVTHLVKLNDAGSLYQPNFMDNEVAETKEGDVIRIEDSHVLRSRRGPNQEQGPERDAHGPSNQVWVEALAFNKQPLPAYSFIREGTFAEKQEEKEGARGKKPQLVPSISLLLPYAIPVSGEMYMMDASHRGDMYQMRAAMALQPYPLIIYNVKGSNDLINYLSNGARAVVHLIGYNPAKPQPQDQTPGRVYRTVNVLAETDSTHLIVEHTRKDPRKHDVVSQGMTTLPPEFKPLIAEAVAKVFGAVEGRAALLMFRDSGEKSFVYPELDSGDALHQLAEMVHRRGFAPVACGAPASMKLGFASIGEFWKALDGIPAAAGQAAAGVRYKRDIEAEFMREAFRQRKFAIVVGFRSGALDLFTMLGIPTISISLRGIVGEDRHGKFAPHMNWKRTNVQYDVPRNNLTRLMGGRGTSKLYMSPYWKMRGAGGPPAQGPQTAKPPGPFHPADLATVAAGLDIGFTKLNPDARYKPKPGDNLVLSEDVLFKPPDHLREFGSTPREALGNLREWVGILLTRCENALDAYLIRQVHEWQLLPEDERPPLKAAVTGPVMAKLEEYRARIKDEIERRRDAIQKRFFTVKVKKPAAKPSGGEDGTV